MTLSFDEIKELIRMGQDLGLQQIQTEGLVVVYGKRAIVPSAPFAVPNDPAKEDEAEDILKRYAAAGKASLVR